MLVVPINNVKPNTSDQQNAAAPAHVRGLSLSRSVCQPQQLKEESTIQPKEHPAAAYDPESAGILFPLD